MSKAFRNQFTFQYGGRECECHYEASYEVHSAEKQTWDYPGCPASAWINRIELLFVETDEEKLENLFADLPSALVDVLEDMAWDDANKKLHDGEI